MLIETDKEIERVKNLFREINKIILIEKNDSFTNLKLKQEIQLLMIEI